MSTRPSWVPGADGSDFDVDNLPYGVVAAGDRSFVGVRIGDQVLDLAAASQRDRPSWTALFAVDRLNLLLAAGPGTWATVRDWVTGIVTDETWRDAATLVPVTDARLRLPFDVGDYVDYYASLHHATNVGRIIRPDGAALAPNWRHLPVAYHGRAGSVVVSGTDVHRPCGQRKDAGDDAPGYGPSRSLDIEAELGFVVGRGVPLGQRVGTDEFAASVFGVVGLNDWSARDIQSWEYVPLGPNLAKSFATSISAWVTPLAALDRARIPLPAQQPTVLPYLQEAEPTGYDIAVEVEINGQVISRPPFSTMYWSPAQLLAHLTVNGASLRPGDLFASGTISGPEKGQRGSLLELTWGGAEPWSADGRTWLRDGDEVVLRYSAPGAQGRIGLGEVRTTILPAIP